MCVPISRVSSPFIVVKVSLDFEINFAFICSAEYYKRPMSLTIDNNHGPAFVDPTGFITMSAFVPVACIIFEPFCCINNLIILIILAVLNILFNRFIYLPYLQTESCSRAQVGFKLFLLLLPSVSDSNASAIGVYYHSFFKMYFSKQFCYLYKKTWGEIWYFFWKLVI